jgi:hypothetical protein
VVATAQIQPTVVQGVRVSRLATPPAALTGNLAGATFRFQTDAPDLAEYARTHLAPLMDGAEMTPQIDARLHWHDGQPPRDRVAAYPHLAGMERVDRDLYVAAGTLHWFRVDDLRDLFVRFTWHDGRLAVEGDFFYRLAKSRNRDRAKRLWYRNRIGALRRRRFTTLLYYLVYYPCWWWLEQTQNLHPIHAAGVSTDTCVILLGGASGVGKSTLAIALATMPGARLLSDSFVLHHGVDVFAVREPILLDAWSRRWLGTQGDELTPIEWRYCLNRSGFQLPPRRLSTGGRAGLLLFPRRAPKAYVRRITAEQAHQRLSAANLIINDLRRYWAFAASLEHLVPGRLVTRREAQLETLTAGVRCFEIGLTAETTCAAALESIRRLLPDTQLRVASGRP